MPRFILIDNHSGFVWGEAIAETPAEACREVDEALGEHGRTYAEAFELASTETGYHVHQAPADFPALEDGTDDDTIAAVDALPRVAVIRCTRQAEDLDA